MSISFCQVTAWSVSMEGGCIPFSGSLCTRCTSIDFLSPSNACSLGVWKCHCNSSSSLPPITTVLLPFGGLTCTSCTMGHDMLQPCIVFSPCPLLRHLSHLAHTYHVLHLSYWSPSTWAGRQRLWRRSMMLVTRLDDISNCVLLICERAQ